MFAFQSVTACYCRVRSKIQRALCVLSTEFGCTGKVCFPVLHLFESVNFPSTPLCLTLRRERSHLRRTHFLPGHTVFITGFTTELSILACPRGIRSIDDAVNAPSHRSKTCLATLNFSRKTKPEHKLQAIMNLLFQRRPFHMPSM